jgi:hypothetical protein
MEHVLLSTLILVISALAGFMPANFKQWTYGLLIATPLSLFLSYIILPVMAFDNPVLLFVIVAMYIMGSLVGSIASDFDVSRNPHSLAIFAGIGSLLIVVSVASILASTSLVRSSDLAAVLDVQDTTEIFDPSSMLMDTEQARFVDNDMAIRATNERLGVKIGLGVMTGIHESTIQNVQGKLTWVSPLAHNSVFKYLANKTTPGYITVSASNVSDTSETLDMPISFGTNGFYFNGDVHRHLYFNGYHGTYLDDYRMELDESGQPYWVVSKFERTVGASGKKITGVVIVDAQTGDIQDIDVSELAEKAPWVDRVQPEDIIFSQIEDWGTLSLGFLNRYFFGREMINPTAGMSLVYTKDGRSMWYTGLQSGAGQDGTVGFMMVDTKTGDATFYRRSEVQEFSYAASSPIPYNVNGISTFVAVLKDAKGNPQMVGPVAYNDRSVLAVGPNLEADMRRYQLAQSQSGSAVSLGDTRDRMHMVGYLDRVGFQQVLESSASLHFTIKDDPELRVFTVSGSDSARYILSRPGDKVAVSYIETGSNPILVKDFDNESL